VSGSCLIFVFVFVCFFVLVLHTTKSWRGGYFLIVCDEDAIQRDDDVLPSGFLSANAARAESGGQLEVVE
jgi:hypothetical protein